MEMKLKDILLEGRYDKVVNQIVKDLMARIKAPSKIYTGDFKKDMGSIKTEIVGAYEIAGVFYMDVYISRIRHTELQDIYIDGAAGAANDEGWDSPGMNENFIQVMIGTHPDEEPKIFSKLVGDLKNLVRHEIEHMTHTWEANKIGDKRRFYADYNKREKIDINDPNSKAKYFLLPKEIDANIHGLYALAKYKKVLYPDVVEGWLDDLVDLGDILPKHKKQIYAKMKKRVKQIGGIPSL